MSKIILSKEGKILEFLVVLLLILIGVSLRFFPHPPNFSPIITIASKGTELEILKGAKQTIIKNPEMKMVIASYHYLKEKEELFQYLKNLKFSPKILGDLIIMQ